MTMTTQPIHLVLDVLGMLCFGIAAIPSSPPIDRMRWVAFGLLAISLTLIF